MSSDLNLTFDKEKELERIRADMLRQSLEDERTDGWFSRMTPAEKAMQAAFLGLGGIDWGQTINFSQHIGMTEANPLLGKRPSRAKVNIMIPLGLALHTGVAYALPRPYRNIWQGLGLLGEGAAVANNYSKGIKPIWPWK